ncbi:hypothetical protein BH18THE2_BH18THE2_14000 [soil metagenome]
MYFVVLPPDNSPSCNVAEFSSLAVLDISNLNLERLWIRFVTAYAVQRDCSNIIFSTNL